MQSRTHAMPGPQWCTVVSGAVAQAKLPCLGAPHGCKQWPSAWVHGGA